MKKLSVNDVYFSIIPYFTEDKKQKKALSEFFELRYHVFNSFGLRYYFSNEPIECDKQDGSYFMLVQDKTGKVHGGRRFCVHLPFSSTKLYVEINTHQSIEEMLPHFDTKSLCYAELGSLCFDDSIRGIGLLDKFYRESFNFLQELNVDFIVSSPVKTNCKNLQNAALKNGIEQIVWRTDIRTIEDGDSDPTIFMSYQNADILPLTPPEMTYSEYAILTDRHNPDISLDRLL